MKGTEIWDNVYSKNDTNKKCIYSDCKVFTAYYSLIIAKNNKYCRQIWILLTKSFHSVLIVHKQVRWDGVESTWVIVYTYASRIIQI